VVPFLGLSEGDAIHDDVPPVDDDEIAIPVSQFPLDEETERLAGSGEAQTLLCGISIQAWKVLELIRKHVASEVNGDIERIITVCERFCISTSSTR
jgi:hypothetical protein